MDLKYYYPCLKWILASHLCHKMNVQSIL